MREIKFRGIADGLYNGVRGRWYYGSLFISPSGTEIRYRDDDGNEQCVSVYPDTVGQYTGYADMHNKPIYEGDIVDIRNWTSEVIWESFCSSGFKLKTIAGEYHQGSLCEMTALICKVKGNIHENKHALELQK